MGLVLPLLMKRHMTDFDVYRRAAQALVHGANVYHSNGFALQFTYPPFASAFVSPLAVPIGLLPGILLTLVSIGCALFVTRRSLDAAALGRWSALVAPVLFVALMWTEPMRTTTRLGQINAVLMALVIADVSGALARLPRGVPTGVAAGVKLTPGVFVLYALATRHRRTAAVAAATFASTVLVGVAVQPAGSWEYWTHLVWDTGRVGSVAFYGNQSLLGVSTRLLGPGPAARVAWALTSLVVVVVGLWVAARTHRQGNGILAAGVVGVISTLVSPISWTHHWVWCIPVCAGLLAARATIGARALGWALCWLVVFEVGPNTVLAHEAFGWAPTRIVVGNDYVIAGLALLAGLAIALRRADRAGPVEAAAPPSQTANSFSTI